MGMMMMMMWMRMNDDVEDEDEDEDEDGDDDDDDDDDGDDDDDDEDDQSTQHTYRVQNSHEGIPGRHISMYARPNGPLHESNPDTYGGQDPYRRICICDTVNPFANQISIHTRFKPLMKAFQEGTSPCMHDQRPLSTHMYM